MSVLKGIGFLLRNFPCSWFENSVPIFVQKMVLFALTVLLIRHTESKTCLFELEALH